MSTPALPEIVVNSGASEANVWDTQVAMPDDHVIVIAGSMDYPVSHEPVPIRLEPSEGFFFDGSDGSEIKAIDPTADALARLMTLLRLNAFERYYVTGERPTDPAEAAAFADWMEERGLTL